MKASLLLTALIAAPYALATTCTSIDDAAERLACYDRLTRCVALSDSTARLTCFDAGFSAKPIDSASSAAAPIAKSPVAAAAATMATAPSAAPEPQAQPVPETKTEQVADKKRRDDELFPLPAPVKGEKNEKDQPRIVARIMSVQKGGKGLTYLTLDNDQVWREVEPNRFAYTPDTEVVITRGVFGSTNLQAEGMTKYVKVKRVR